MLLVLSLSALATEVITVEVGTAAASNVQSATYKLNRIEPDTDVVLQGFTMRLGADGGERVQLVLYEQRPITGWDLLYTSGDLRLAAGDGFVGVEGLSVPLVAGEAYLVGVWIRDSVRYYYEDGWAPGDLGFGEQTGAAFSPDFGAIILPDPLFDDVDESLAYYGELVVEVPSDEDEDGFDERVDCDDGNRDVYPGAPEYCDGLDNDCDGEEDEDVVTRLTYTDEDGDGYGDGTRPVEYCERLPPPGTRGRAGDCNDLDATINPAAVEVCDGVDQDCDGMADDGLEFTTWYPDSDEDGFGSEDGGVSTCAAGPPGFVPRAGDCADDDPTRAPNVPERCDGIDQDCDALIDEEVLYVDYYPDADGDGFGDAASAPRNACDGPSGSEVVDNTDCDDRRGSVFPGAPETCDDRDQDCDGQVDEGLLIRNYWPDADGDGQGDGAQDPVEGCLPADGVPNDSDCDDTRAEVYQGAPELCDELDNDCDRAVDEDVVFQTWYPDQDGDGFGVRPGVETCDGPPSGHAAQAGDCDDAEASRAPGLTEVCDGLDNDCDETLLSDEGLDEDGDGWPACRDCDDADAATFPGAPEACDGTDRDCDGFVPVATDCADFPSESFAPTAAGCGASHHPGLPFLAGCLALALTRRRRHREEEPGAPSPT